MKLSCLPTCQTELPSPSLQIMPLATWAQQASRREEGKPNTAELPKLVVGWE